MASIQGRIKHIGGVGTFTNGQPNGVFRVLVGLAPSAVAFIQLECDMGLIGSLGIVQHGIVKHLQHSLTLGSGGWQWEVRIEALS